MLRCWFSHNWKCAQDLHHGVCVRCGQQRLLEAPDLVNPLKYLSDDELIAMAARTGREIVVLSG